MNTFQEALPPDVLYPPTSIQQTPSRFPFLVLIGPHAASQAMLTFAARLAVHSPLRVLDGGNRFDARKVARLLRNLNAPDLYAALGRIRISRAFTCYQMLALLEQTPSGLSPTLVIDLLDTFYDESAPLEERHRLIQRCLAHLRSLSRHAPVAVSLRPPPPSQTDPTGLLDIVQQAADSLWFQEDASTISGPQHPSQPTLFADTEHRGLYPAG